MVRPTKYHPARVDAICDALRAGATIEHAAEAAGIHRDTVHEWRTRYPAFADRIKEAEGAGVLASLRVIRGAAEGGTWQAAAWLLERRYPAEYGRRAVTVATSVQVGQAEVSHQRAQLAKHHQRRQLESDHPRQQPHAIQLLLRRHEEIKPHLIGRVETRQDDGRVDPREDHHPAQLRAVSRKLADDAEAMHG